MSEYRVIFRSDETTEDNPILWEPGCPMLIKAVQVSRNIETGKAYLQVKVENLTADTIQGVIVKATVAYSSESDQELELRELDADIPSGDAYQLKPAELAHGDIAGARTIVASVTAPNGNWASKSGAQPVPKPSKISLSSKALAERRLRLGSVGDRDDVPYSKPTIGNDWWACGCGQLNVRTDTCLRCGVNRATLEETCNNDQLEAWADEREGRRVQQAYTEARGLQEKGTLASLEKAITLLETTTGYEDTDTRLPECRKTLDAAKSRHKSKAKRIAITIVAIVAAGFIFVFLWTYLLVPMQAYNVASTEAEAGQYEKALGDFEKLGDYRDSQARAKDMALKYAESLVESGDYISAISQYQNLGMDDKVKETKYAYCQAHQDNTDINTYTYLIDLGDYRDAQTMLHTLFDPKLDFEVVAPDELVQRGWLDQRNGFDKVLLITYRGGGAPTLGNQFTLKVSELISTGSKDTEITQRYIVQPANHSYTVDAGQLQSQYDLIGEDKHTAMVGIDADDLAFLTSVGTNGTLTVKIFLEDSNTDIPVYEQTFNIVNDSLE